MCAAARRLQVEQPDAPIRDEHVAVVQIAVRPAGGVQARDEIRDRVAAARGAPRGCSASVCFSVRPSRKRVAITSSPLVQLGEGERLGNRHSARVQSDERAPLPARGFESEDALPGLAQAMPTPAARKVLEEDDLPVREARAHEAPVPGLLAQQREGIARARGVEEQRGERVSQRGIACEEAQARAQARTRAKCARSAATWDSQP